MIAASWWVLWRMSCVLFLLATLAGALIWLQKAREYCRQTEPAHRADVYSRSGEDGPFYARCRKPGCDWFSATVPQYYVAQSLGIAHVKYQQMETALYDQRVDETALRNMTLADLEELYRDSRTPREVVERIDALGVESRERRDWERSR
jgi:hypothetical protein